MSYNFDHYVISRYSNRITIKSFRNESPIAQQLNPAPDLQQTHTLLIRQEADFT